MGTVSWQALCSLLRRDASINFKAKGNSLVSVLACNLLMAAYEEDENWPEIFVKVSRLPRKLGERAALGQSRRSAMGAGEIAGLRKGTAANSTFCQGSCLVAQGPPSPVPCMGCWEVFPGAPSGQLAAFGETLVLPPPRPSP